MKLIRILFYTFSVVLFSSCGGGKKIVSSQHPPLKKEEPKHIIEEPVAEHLAEPETKPVRVVENALAFLGTSYKYGGSTENGMDCSGLVFTAFQQEEIALPRSSRDMSLLGHRLNLDEVNTGDLLFFETDKKKKVINHVGLVVELEADKIFFIHSTTSQGVIISTMDENYWQEHFVMARRIQIN